MGHRAGFEPLAREVEQAQQRFNGPALPDFPEAWATGPRHFDYESVLYTPSSDTASSDEMPRHAFARRARDSFTRSGTPRALLSVVDVAVAGVPFYDQRPTVERGSFGGRVTEFVHLSGGPAFGCSDGFDVATWPAEHLQDDTLPVRRPTGRVTVTFAQPKDEAAGLESFSSMLCPGDELPGERAGVDLDFRAPAFCAESSLTLDELLAPELRRELPAPTTLQSRLEFDARGTFNRPPSALPSPGGGLDVERELEPRSFAISRPFFVVLHDPESGAIYDSLGVWKVPSGINYVSTHATGPSGDWNHCVDYCFRGNGTLAWMESELRTFYGSVRRVRTRRFDVSGKVTFTAVRVFNLQTGEPLKDPAFMDQDEPIYLRFKDLPVAELLGTPKPVREK